MTDFFKYMTLQQVAQSKSPFESVSSTGACSVRMVDAVGHGFSESGDREAYEVSRLTEIVPSESLLKSIPWRLLPMPSRQPPARRPLAVPDVSLLPRIVSRRRARRGLRVCCARPSGEGREGGKRRDAKEEGT